jgi:hypothetical protein
VGSHQSHTIIAANAKVGLAYTFGNACRRTTSAASAKPRRQTGRRPPTSGTATNASSPTTHTAPAMAPIFAAGASSAAFHTTIMINIRKM